MKPRLLPAVFLACLLAAVALIGSVGMVQADGIIIPPPCADDRCPPPPPCVPEWCPPPPRPIAQLVVKYHRVQATITDQLATTRVDQVFANPNSWDIEGTYIFPLPPGAVATGLKLWVDGEPVEGRLLDATEARRLYEQTVYALRDPALLEYSGRGALQLSLFPIPAGGERRIQVEYTQALPAEGGLVRYTYPLNTEKFSAQPLEQVSVQVEIRDNNGLRTVYSPTHPVEIRRDDLQRATVSYEAENVLPDSDFTLFFSTGGETGLHLLTFRDPGDPQDADGYFLLLLASGALQDAPAVPKDLLLVLDRSGSMEGEKFRQAQEALRYILQRLNPEDRFYLQSFSSSVQAFDTRLRPASDVSEAIGWVDRLGASGSTDINRALLDAAAAGSQLADPTRPLYMVFLTDGLPTSGEVQTQMILDNFLRAAPSNLRMFVFGVGYDVDTVLLDNLSSDHDGKSSYIRPGEPLGEKLSAFYESISRPVLTDLELDFGGLGVYDLYPNPLPDLFAGSQVLVAGRYREGGTTTLTVRGRSGAALQTLTYTAQPFAVDSRTDDAALGAIARIWASRKIGALLNQIRLSGADEETVAQIVRLSVRFGIVTPYTSYLVDEPMPLGAESQRKIAEDAYSQIQAAPMEVSGQNAVERAAQEGELQAAQAAPANPGSQDRPGANAIRIAAGRTFVYTQNGWTDTTYDPQTMTPVELVFLSDEYFRTAQSRPDLAAAFALGEQVIVVSDGKAYRVSASPDHDNTGVPSATLPPVEVQPSATPRPAAQSDQPTVTPPPARNPAGDPTGGCPPVLMLAGLAVIVSLLTKKRDN